MSSAAKFGQRKKDRIDALAESGTLSDEEGVSLWQSAWRRLRRDPVFLIGATVITTFVVVAVIAPFVAPYDPTRAVAELPARSARPPVGWRQRRP